MHAIVERSGVIRREPVAQPLDARPSAIPRVIEPSIPYLRINTPWGPAAHVAGEWLELPR